MLNRLRLGALALVIMLLCLSAVSRINGAPLTGDAPDNFRFAYHLAYDGVMGEQSGQSIMPTNLREPLPIMLSALWIKVVPALAHGHTLQSMTTPEALALLKLVNLFWVIALLVGAACLMGRVLDGRANPMLRFAFQLTGVLLVYEIFPTGSYANNLMTELPAAALLLWFAWAVVAALQSGRRLYWLLAGVLYGGLVLTKGAFAYVGIVAATLWVVRALCYRQGDYARGGLLMLAAALVVVTPWLARNYVQLGEWSLTGRGPIVLLTRAYKNAMTETEFVGAFYAYGPQFLKPALTRWTGFSVRDRLLGGRLERLRRFHPGDEAARDAGDEAGAVSYYCKATARARNITADYARRYSNPIEAGRQADAATKALAMEKITADPAAHLRASLVFAWRGAWPHNIVDGMNLHKPVSDAWRTRNLVGFAGLLAVLGMSLAGFLRGGALYWAIALVPTGWFAFHALFTHFIPRYSIPMIPLWIVGMLMLIAVLLSRAQENSKRERDAI